MKSSAWPSLCARLRGTELIQLFRQIAEVRVTAVCDVDQQLLDWHQQEFDRRRERVVMATDFRRLLDRQDIDAVAIATPDHWHALMAVWACEAGKDVYLEKPVSHNIWEGRKIVEAARKYQRIVQTGTQNRSDTGLHEARRWLHAGNLGKVLMARAFDYPGRESLGHVTEPQSIPGGVDYNLFQGPAPLDPLLRKNLHYDWHYFWSTGTGDCGNRGVHSMDHTRWMAGETRPPTACISLGGRFGWDDDGQTPNTQLALFTGTDVPLLWELKTLRPHGGTREPDNYQGHRRSMVLECEGGQLVGGRGGAVAWDRQGQDSRFPGR